MTATKIVVTIGPASRSVEMLGRLMDEGIDVVRLNMSHGGLGEHAETLTRVRELAENRGINIAVMADLAGPKVRTGRMDPHANIVSDGARCEIVREDITGTAQRFSTNHEGFIKEVEIGHPVLIDDGQVRLRVTEKRRDALVCICEEGGPIGTRKGVNVPDSELSLSALTEKDHEDLAWAVKNGVDFVALSFVRRPKDVLLLREALGRLGGEVPILAKIETPQAIQAIDGIIEAADGIMVARGDLGVEMDVTRVPLLQKDIVLRCRAAGTPVIIATQMLHSMIEQPTPTRAEVSDVANAALDGADAVMLSGETAAGKYPVAAVRYMNRICADVDRFTAGAGERRGDVDGLRLRVGYEIDKVASAVARSAAMVAHDLAAELVAVWSQTGRTARWLSKYHLRMPMVALSSDGAVCRRLALSYGIAPMLVPADRADCDRLWSEVEGRLRERFALREGGYQVIVGDPVDAMRRGSITIWAL